MNMFCFVLTWSALSEIPEENTLQSDLTTKHCCCCCFFFPQISFPLHNRAELLLWHRMTKSGEGLIYAVGFYYEVIFSVSFKLPVGTSVWLYDSFSMTRHKGQTWQPWNKSSLTLLASHNAVDFKERARERDSRAERAWPCVLTHASYYCSLDNLFLNSMKQHQVERLSNYKELLTGDRGQTEAMEKLLRLSTTFYHSFLS